MTGFSRKGVHFISRSSSLVAMQVPCAGDVVDQRRGRAHPRRHHRCRFPWCGAVKGRNNRRRVVDPVYQVAARRMLHDRQPVVFHRISRIRVGQSPQVKDMVAPFPVDGAVGIVEKTIRGQQSDSVDGGDRSTTAPVTL